MKLIIIIISLIFSFSLYSQQDSLFSYLETATKNNPTVLQKYHEYQAALQKIPQVGALRDPELSLGIFLSPMEIVNGKQVADIRLMQMFPWFGVLKNAKDEMSLMAKAKYQAFLDAKLLLSFDVQRLWYQLYKVRKNIRISEESKALLQTIERLAVVKYKTSSFGGSTTSGANLSNLSVKAGGNTSSMSSMSGGTASASESIAIPSNAMSSSSMGATASGSQGLIDLYRIQIEMSELDNNISLLKNQEVTITARFNAGLNRPMKAMVFTPVTLSPQVVDSSQLAFSETLFAKNPMLEMIKYEQQSLEARKKMVTQMSYPMVGLGVNYSLIAKNEMITSPMNGADMIMPMVTLTLPIYRGKYKAMQKEIDQLRLANDQTCKATSNALQTEYFEAMRLYQDASRRIRLYENQSQLSKKSLDIMVKSFSSSGASLNDILRIQQQNLDYQSKKVEALTDFNTAVAWLNRLIATAQK